MRVKTGSLSGPIRVEDLPKPRSSISLIADTRTASLSALSASANSISSASSAYLRMRALGLADAFRPARPLELAIRRGLLLPYISVGGGPAAQSARTEHGKIYAPCCPAGATCFMPLQPSHRKRWLMARACFRSGRVE